MKPSADTLLLGWLARNPSRVGFRAPRWGYITPAWGRFGYWHPAKSLRAAIRSAQRFYPR